MTTKDPTRLLVDVELGVTLPAGEFANVKPRVTIHNLDPEGDVAKQVEVALVTAARAFVEIDGSLDQVLSEILAPETGEPGFKSRLKVVEVNVKTASSNIRRIADKVKKMDADLTRVMEARRDSRQEEA